MGARLLSGGFSVLAIVFLSANGAYAKDILTKFDCKVSLYEMVYPDGKRDLLDFARNRAVIDDLPLSKLEQKAILIAASKDRKFSIVADDKFVTSSEGGTGGFGVPMPYEFRASKFTWGTNGFVSLTIEGETGKFQAKGEIDLSNGNSIQRATYIYEGRTEKFKVIAHCK